MTVFASLLKFGLEMSVCLGSNEICAHLDED